MTERACETVSVFQVRSPTLEPATHTDVVVEPVVVGPGSPWPDGVVRRYGGAWSVG